MSCDFYLQQSCLVSRKNPLETIKDINVIENKGLLPDAKMYRHSGRISG